MTDIKGRDARQELFARVQHAVRVRARRLDRIRLAYLDATWTTIGQYAVRLLIASAVLFVVLAVTIAVLWFG